jgi:DNA-binding response OmpR family regulator
MPVVILNSSREESDVSNGYDPGANSYVVKPVDLGEFQHAVNQLGPYWLVINRPPVHPPEG